KQKKDDSIDMCISSPPYWGLRSYGEKAKTWWDNNSWYGQLGLEPDFDLYVKHIVQIFNEVKRVLKPEGTCWLNLGESYSGGGGISGVPEDWDSISMNNREKYPENPPAKKTRLPSKCMIGIPW